MTISPFDTIAAVSTPRGRGGVALLRISGRDAVAVCERVFVAKNKKPLTEEEKAAKKQHIKEEIQAYVCMFLFIALFVVMFAMFGSQSNIFGR